MADPKVKLKIIGDSKEAQRAVAGLTRSLKNAVAALAGIAGVSIGLAGLVSLLKDASKAAREFEASGVRLGIMFGDIAAGEKMVKQIDDLVRDLPVYAHEAIAAARVMVTWGIAQQDVTKHLKSLSKATLITGADMNRLTVAVAQLSSPTSFGMGVRSLTLMGFKVKEFGKFTEGAVGSTEEAFREFGRYLEVEFPGAVEAWRETTESKVRAVKANWTRAMIAMGDSINKELRPILDSLTKELVESEDAFRGAGIAIGGVIKMVKGLTDAVGYLLPGLGDMVDELSMFGELAKAVEDAELWAEAVEEWKAKPKEKKIPSIWEGLKGAVTAPFVEPSIVAETKADTEELLEIYRDMREMKDMEEAILERQLEEYVEIKDTIGGVGEGMDYTATRAEQFAESIHQARLDFESVEESRERWTETRREARLWRAELLEGAYRYEKEEEAEEAREREEKRRRGEDIGRDFSRIVKGDMSAWGTMFGHVAGRVMSDFLVDVLGDVLGGGVWGFIKGIFMAEGGIVKAAGGLEVPARPGGYLVNIGEGMYDELVIPKSLQGLNLAREYLKDYGDIAQREPTVNTYVTFAGSVLGDYDIFVSQRAGEDESSAWEATLV